MTWGVLPPVAAALLWTGAALAQECSLVGRHSQPMNDVPGGVLVVSVLSNGAIHFRANMDVNTDGAGNSYHPDEDIGATGRSNTLCNGIGLMPPPNHNSTVYGIGPGACPPFLKEYSKAKAAGWRTDASTPKVDWFGIATTQRNGLTVPCIQGPQDPFPGFFVSKTSYEDSSRASCDVRRYADANTVPSIVVPNNGLFLTTLGIRSGHAAYVYRSSNKVAADAIVGDFGPSKSAGEGSVILAQILGNKPQKPPQSVPESYALALPYGIDYFIIPGERARGAVTRASVEGFASGRRTVIGFSLEKCLAAVKP